MSRIHVDEEGWAFDLDDKLAVIIDPEAFPEPVTRLTPERMTARQGVAYVKAAQIIALISHRLGIPLE